MEGSLLVALIIGFVTGWLMSMPIGPVNAAVISRTLKYTWKHGLATGVGAALMDILYCGGAAQINQFLVESPIINLLFQAVGFGALLFLGIKQIRARTTEPPKPEDEKRHEQEDEERAANAMKRMRVKKKKNLLGPFVLGVLLYATNVAAVPEWIIVAGLWRGWGLLGRGWLINAAFAIGAGLGTAGWYGILIQWISKRHRGFQPSTLKKINFGTGIAMLVFGVYFGYQIIFVTDWSNVKSHFKDNTGQMIDSVR